MGNKLLFLRDIASTKRFAIFPVNSLRLGVTPQEAFVKPKLGLAAQVVVHPGQHHNQLVAGVGSLTDKAGVV